MFFLTFFRFQEHFPPALSPEVGCEDLLEEDRLDVLGGRKNTRGKTFVVSYGTMIGYT